MVVVDVLAHIQVLLRQGFGIPSGNGKLLLAGKPRAQNRWVEQMETRREIAEVRTKRDTRITFGETDINYPN